MNMGTWKYGSMGAWERGRRSAFTLVEVLMTILVISVGLVASMRAMPVLIEVSRATHEQLLAQQLAGEMLAEISMLPYEDPNTTPGFGPESGEATTTRADFDDIDDYHGWTESPPQRKDGSLVPDADGFTRSVTVQNVLTSDFTTAVSNGGSDAKRIIIRVTLPGMSDVTVTTVRLRGANREDL
jgi:prepilin-type N-terminal cleavage/methylation domain-containing protein